MPHDDDFGADLPPEAGPVRRAARGDKAAISRMLAAAFHDDPAMRFIFPDDADRRHRLPAFFALLFDGAAANGQCLATAGGEAATLWRAPGTGTIGFWEKLTSIVVWLRAAGLALPRAAAVEDAINAHHPKTPFWYLHIAGCDPARQGRGFGTAAIRAGLAKADADNMPAFLKTAKLENVRFYERLGFAVTHEWEVPRGPKFWSMLRPPGG